MQELKNYVVLYREADQGPLEQPKAFQCLAEDYDHAEEQCENAYPDAFVVGIYRLEPSDNQYQEALDIYYEVNLWVFQPSSTASILYVETPSKEVYDVIARNADDIVVEADKRKLEDEGWPKDVVEQIKAHFSKVFSLSAEVPKGEDTSPRGAYVRGLNDWQFQSNGKTA